MEQPIRATGKQFVGAPFWDYAFKRLKSVMRDSSTYMGILDEGGILALRCMILSMGGKKFGRPRRETKDQVNQIDDLETLQRLFGHILKARSWNSLFKQLTSHP